MSSLRLRFFLITWPLVVVAVVGVALFFSRWADVELEQLVATEVIGAEEAMTLGAPHQSMVDTLSAWLLRDVNGLSGGPSSVDLSPVDLASVDLASPDTALLNQEVAELLEANDIAEAVVILGADGDLIATTDKDIRVEEVTGLPEGAASLLRSKRSNGVVSEESIVISGQPLFDASEALAARIYFIPTTRPETSIRMQAPVIRANARRTLLIAVLLASLAAATAALLLARPIVRQISSLADAAAKVRDGNLDVRLIVRSKDEIGELERSFNSMAESLAAAEVHKKNVVSDAAHELRTPLTNLVGILEAIRDGLMAPNEETLATLQSEARLMVALVDELQELSLAESGQLDYALEALDAGDEATKAMLACKPQAHGRHLVTLSPDESIFVLADQRRLRQVLGNLLQNALKHTDASDRISIAVERTDDGVAFSVTDSGKGIPRDELPLIWERFHRVDPSRHRDSGGMGLGLAVVRQLVLGMGGQVSVESELGVGSTFRVVLPSGDRRR